MSADVGIILPVYNGIPFLSEAVNSVLAQTYPTWELYLVDDYSTDGSREWIEHCSDPRIRKIYHESNRGLYPTLQEVIEDIPNEWAVILMQDDRLKPTYIAKMHEVASRFPQVRAFWASEDLIDAEGILTVSGGETGGVEVVEPGVRAWRNALLRGTLWTISGSFTHRDLYRAIPFCLDLPHAADYEWFLRVLRRERMVYYEQSLVQIRISSRQASARNLATAQDLGEFLVIHRENVVAYRQDLKFKTVLQLCMTRWNNIARRLVQTIRRGRPMVALRLVRYAWGYAQLLLSFIRRGSAPARESHA